MFIKKYAFFIALLGLCAGFVNYSMDDAMEIVKEPSDVKNLQYLHGQILKNIAGHAPLKEIQGVMDIFIDTFDKNYVASNNCNLNAYIQHFLRVATRNNRVDVLECYSDYLMKYTLTDEKELEDQKIFLESLANNAYYYRAVASFKYLMQKMLDTINCMPLCQRIKYEVFNITETIYLTPIPLCSSLYSTSSENTKYFIKWVQIFIDYWDYTHLLSTKNMPDLEKNREALTANFGSLKTMQKYGRVIKHEYLDEKAQSFFNGTYYYNALTNVALWYKKSNKQTQKIILECAQMCGHHDVTKAIQSMSMRYILDRRHGKK